MASDTERNRLKALLVQRSLKIGNFTLASGARSSYYIDARRTTMSAEGLALTGKVCLDLIREAGLDVSWVGGLTMGADPVSYAIAHHSWLVGTPLNGFSVRKTAKDYGTGQRIEGGLPRDARVLVVEDSMTSGGSSLKAVEAIAAHGAHVACILTLVDREEGGRERVKAAGHRLLSVFTARDLLGEVAT